MQAVDLVVQTSVGHRQGGLLSQPAREITFLTGEGTRAATLRGDELAKHAAPVHERHQQQVSVNGIEQFFGKGSTGDVVVSVPDDGVAGGGPTCPRDEMSRRTRARGGPGRAGLAQHIVAGAQVELPLGLVEFVQEAGTRAQTQTALTHDLLQHLLVVQRACDDAAGAKKGGEPSGPVVKIRKCPRTLSDVVQRDQSTLRKAGVVREHRDAHFQPSPAGILSGKLELDLAARRCLLTARHGQLGPAVEHRIHRLTQSLSIDAKKSARACVGFHEPIVLVDHQHTIRQRAQQGVTGAGSDLQQPVAQQTPSQQQRDHREAEWGEVEVLLEEAVPELIDEVHHQRQDRGEHQRQSLPSIGPRGRLRRPNQPPDADRHREVDEHGHAPPQEPEVVAPFDAHRGRHDAHL